MAPGTWRVSLLLALTTLQSGQAFLSGGGSCPVKVPLVNGRSSPFSTYGQEAARSTCRLSAAGSDDEDRELSILEAEQARLRAELEAARLKAELARLQKEQGQAGVPRAGRDKERRGWGSGGSSSSSSSARKDTSDDMNGPVSKKTGLQAATPVSQRGARVPRSKRKEGREWGIEPSLPSSGAVDPDKEARYSQVVQELVNALQDSGKDRSKLDVKKIMDGIRAARAASEAMALSAPTGQQLREKEMMSAIRKGEGNALVQRIIGTGSMVDEQGQPPNKMERLSAWASLVIKTVSASQHSVTAEKLMGMKDLVDRLLPKAEVTAQDVTVTHMAIIRELAGKVSDEYPEVRRRRANLLYVLLNLPISVRGPGTYHEEEVAIGQYMSMEASLGQGCRSVFESSLADTLPSSTDAMALMDPKAFHKTAKALVDFGLSSRHMLATTRLPIGEAAKGMTFFLLPWLRRVTKRVLEEAQPSDATAKLGMIMELCVHAAESIALVQGKQPDNAEDFGRAIQSILAEKFTGISIELGSGVRQMVFASYVRGWLEEGLLGTSNAVSWQPAELGMSFKLSRRDVETWDLARQVLALSEVQLLFVAKDTVPQVMGEVLARVLMEHEGEWPRGQAAFERDYQRVYRRLKYDKYEGDGARCKSVRVLADSVLAKMGQEPMREKAVEWGCKMLELSRESFEQLAIEQATFELQAEVLDKMLGPGSVVEADELQRRITQLGVELRLPEHNVGKATTAAIQVHVCNLAARALFADMEGQPVKAFKEIENTLSFIDAVAAPVSERFGVELDPVGRIAEDDALQLANICTKMLSRKQFAESAERFLEMLGYEDRVMY